MTRYDFSQIDVFTTRPLGGNPVAVVHDADGLSEAQMAAFARWTNLSETTFLLEPTDPTADYRLRIFTPSGELPFAGHPTLGSAHAWLSRRGEEHEELVQECAAGLVTLKVTGERLAFAAPPCVRSGEVEEEIVERIVASLRIDPADLLATQWVDNGPGWVGALLRDGELVRGIEPDFTAMDGLKLGIIGPQEPGADTAFEVRAFIAESGRADEDPVTGSLNASLAQWLIATERAPKSYVAAQGTVLQREGRVHVDVVGTEVWVGGTCTPVITGSVEL